VSGPGSPGGKTDGPKGLSGSRWFIGSGSRVSSILTPSILTPSILTPSILTPSILTPSILTPSTVTAALYFISAVLPVGLRKTTGFRQIMHLESTMPSSGICGLSTVS
jgi:hypothetical protein